MRPTKKGQKIAQRIVYSSRGLFHGGGFSMGGAFPWRASRRAVSLSLLVSCLLAPLLLDGCAFMPSTGPFASNVLDKHSNSIPVENANEDIAYQLWQEVLHRRQENIDKTLTALGQPAIQPQKIAVGDYITLSLWSQSAGQQSVLQTAPHQTDMGVYIVALNGTVDLPYVGPVTVAGLTPQEAEKIIAARYAKAQQFPKAEAVVMIKRNKGQNIVIIGSVNKPITLDWPEGGLTVSEALGGAGGFRVFAASYKGGDIAVNNVMIIRHGKDYSLPLKTVLEHHVQLVPGDTLVVRQKPLVRATCLGAGWASPTVINFDKQPTLAKVLSLGQISWHTAQGRGVFVFKHDFRMIYRVNIDTPEGMRTAQWFPIADQDLVYIPPSRSTTLQQITQIIMSVAYPAALGASYAAR